MFKIKKLKNNLTLITIPLPYLDSVTVLLAVGAGSRYENKKISGISHFLEHMFFKGSLKYPTSEQIATIIDGIGAVNNAATDKEVTYYYIKSAAKHIDLASDILSSQLKESLFQPEEIEREKGVIIEEIRMYKDAPSRYVFTLFENLFFGDQPLGWDIAGEEDAISSIKRQDFINYVESLYAPENMVLVYAGNIPKDIDAIAEKYFADLPKNSQTECKKVTPVKQTAPKINLFYKKTDQVNLVLGVQGYSRKDEKRYAARVLSIILGEGMSSRLFIQVRERRGLAYHVGSYHEGYKDTGYCAAYGGLKLEKIQEGLETIKTELERTVTQKVTDAELKKAKEMERGRIALRSESTNFLAEYFGIKQVLDGEIETFDDYLKKIDTISADDVKQVAGELFKTEKYNLQMIGPLKDPKPFEQILKK